MKICDDPSDPEKVRQCIAEVDAFFKDYHAAPWTSEEIAEIMKPVPKNTCTAIIIVPCERKDGA